MPRAVVQTATLSDGSRFERGLTTRRNPGFLRPLGHAVTGSAPTGIVRDLISPAGVPVQRVQADLPAPIDPRRLRVQPSALQSGSVPQAAPLLVAAPERTPRTLPTVSGPPPAVLQRSSRHTTSEGDAGLGGAHLAPSVPPSAAAGAEPAPDPGPLPQAHVAPGPGMGGAPLPGGVDAPAAGEGRPTDDAAAHAADGPSVSGGPLSAPGTGDAPSGLAAPGPSGLDGAPVPGPQEPPARAPSDAGRDAPTVGRRDPIGPVSRMPATDQPPSPAPPSSSVPGGRGKRPPGLGAPLPGLPPTAAPSSVQRAARPEVVVQALRAAQSQTGPGPAHPSSSAPAAPRAPEDQAAQAGAEHVMPPPPVGPEGEPSATAAAAVDAGQRSSGPGDTGPWPPEPLLSLGRELPSVQLAPWRGLTSPYGVPPAPGPDRSAGSEDRAGRRAPGPVAQRAPEAAAGAGPVLSGLRGAPAVAAAGLPVLPARPVVQRATAGGPGAGSRGRGPEATPVPQSAGGPGGPAAILSPAPSRPIQRLGSPADAGVGHVRRAAPESTPDLGPAGPEQRDGNNLVGGTSPVAAFDGVPYVDDVRDSMAGFALPEPSGGLAEMGPPPVQRIRMTGPAPAPAVVAQRVAARPLGASAGGGPGREPMPGPGVPDGLRGGPARASAGTPAPRAVRGGAPPTAPVPSAGDAAVALGIAQRMPDGSVEFATPESEALQGPPVQAPIGGTVQRAVAAAPAEAPASATTSAAASTEAGSGGSAGEQSDADRLASQALKMYPIIARQLRLELSRERDRWGHVSGFQH